MARLYHFSDELVVRTDMLVAKDGTVITLDFDENHDVVSIEIVDVDHEKETKTQKIGVSNI